MSEIRDQLICYLQEVIQKRFEEKKVTSVNNLVGIVSQFKEFREWLQNNYRHDLKLNLLSLIQEDRHHFHYDFTSGLISNGHQFVQNASPVSASIVKRPKFFNDLMDNQSLDTIDDYLSVLELILFIVKETANQSISITYLMKSIEKNCKKQFNCYKLMVKIHERKSDSDFDEKVLNQFLMNQLKPIFTFNSENCLTIDTNIIDMSQLLSFLTKSSLLVIKNCLHKQLYRFGRRYSYDLNEWFVKKYEIATDFMANRGLTLDLIIGLYPEVFDLQIIDKFIRIVSLNPQFLGKTRSLELELMYKYGFEIRKMFGIVTKVTETLATIESQIEFEVKDQKFKPEFKVITELVHILGQQVLDLRLFLHSGDPICFDVKFITNFESIWSEGCSDQLWIVSGIHNVRHSAKCYVQSILFDWKYEDSSVYWSSCGGSDSTDSDDSEYDFDRNDDNSNSD